MRGRKGQGESVLLWIMRRCMAGLDLTHAKKKMMKAGVCALDVRHPHSFLSLQCKYCSVYPCCGSAAVRIRAVAYFFF